MNIALVSFLKDESPYIIEHYLWYKKLGITTFYYVYNNCSDDSEHVLKFLNTIDSNVNFVENIVKEGTKPQISGANTVFPIIKANQNIDYVLMVDMDEFLVLKKDKSLQSLIEKFKNPDVISFNWAIFGSSYETDYNDKPVINRFIKRASDDDEVNRSLKSLWKLTETVRGFGPHRPFFTNDQDITDLKWIVPTENKEKSNVYYEFRKGSSPLSEGKAALDTAQLNHYAVKSHEEFINRRTRGRGMGKKGVIRHNDEYFKSMDKNEVTDDLAKEQFSSYISEYQEIKSKYKDYLSHLSKVQNTASKSLYLHIGCHKTGSSSLQKSLLNAKEQLNELNWDFLHLDKDGNSSNIVEFEHDKLGLITRISNKIDQLINNVQYDNNIISGEHLSAINNKKLLLSLKNKLNKEFSNIKIVVYLRRQDKLALSFKQQSSKGTKRNQLISSVLCGHSPNALPELTTALYEYLDFNKKISLWEEVFGEENIIIANFDELHGNDICLDFSTRLNLQTKLESLFINEGVNRRQSLVSHKLIENNAPPHVIRKIRKK
ncbi:glycosyltransferase family 2 protein [Psychromonas sp. GE-S-Ul-11]